MISRPSGLLVRVPNWVGDVCKSLPAIQALRDSGFAVHLALRRPLDDLVAGLGLPTTTVGRGVFRPARSLRAAGCRNALLLATSFGTAAAARVAGLRAVGFSEDYRDRLLLRAVDYPMGEHEVDAIVYLARVAQQTFAPDAAWPAGIDGTPALPLASKHIAEAEAALDAHGIARPFTLICPLATGTRRRRSKVWPHWRELGQLLAADGHRLVTCPGPGEEQACAAMVPAATALEGLGLGAYAAVASRAERVLANDSGPLYMAAAVGANVLGIYGWAVPSVSEPRGAEFVDADGDWPAVDEVMARADL